MDQMGSNQSDFGLRFPGNGQVTPLADDVIGFSQDILPATAAAGIHPEIPAPTLAGRVREIRIALENGPTGAVARILVTVVESSLAALKVPHRPEPGFKGERNTGVI